MNIEQLSESVNKELLKYEMNIVDSRQTSTINPRLIRHYSSIGLLSIPIKLGKVADYNESHIWELLFIRKMLNERFGLESIKKILDEFKADEINYIQQIRQAIDDSNESVESQEPPQINLNQDNVSLKEDALDFLNMLSPSNLKKNTASASIVLGSNSTNSNLIKSMYSSTSEILRNATKQKILSNTTVKQVVEYQVRDYLRLSLEKSSVIKEEEVESILIDIKKILKGEVK
jgi:DNA-binding transcriptional MerR regulator